MDELVRLALEVHESDGYPMYLPGDMRAFIATPDSLGAWVVLRDGAIAGHVALRPRSSDAVMAAAAAALGMAEENLAVVARLLVSPRHRRAGIGAALLERAAAEARARGLWPVLDVVAGHSAAVSLYERRGWLCAGRVRARWGSGPEVEELVYVAPAAEEEPGAGFAAR